MYGDGLYVCVITYCRQVRLWLILSVLSPQALQVALAEHQGEVDYLTSAVEQVFQKAPTDISQK